MTYIDVGNAGFAGAKTSPCHPGIQNIKSPCGLDPHGLLNSNNG